MSYYICSSLLTVLLLLNLFVCAAEEPRKEIHGAAAAAAAVILPASAGLAGQMVRHCSRKPLAINVGNRPAMHADEIKESAELSPQAKREIEAVRAGLAHLARGGPIPLHILFQYLWWDKTRPDCARAVARTRVGTVPTLKNGQVTHDDTSLYWTDGLDVYTTPLSENRVESVFAGVPHEGCENVGIERIDVTADRRLAMLLIGCRADATPELGLMTKCLSSNALSGSSYAGHGTLGFIYKLDRRLIVGGQFACIALDTHHVDQLHTLDCDWARVSSVKRFNQRLLLAKVFRGDHRRQHWAEFYDATTLAKVGKLFQVGRVGHPTDWVQNAFLGKEGCTTASKSFSYDIWPRVAVLSDDRLLVHQDKRIECVNAETGDRIGESCHLEHHIAHMLRLKSMNGTSANVSRGVLTVAHDGALSHWQATKENMEHFDFPDSRRYTKRHYAFPKLRQLSHDVVVCAIRSKVDIWDVTTQRRMLTVENGIGMGTPIYFKPCSGGGCVVAGADGKFAHWSPKSDIELAYTRKEEPKKAACVRSAGAAAISAKKIKLNNN